MVQAYNNITHNSLSASHNNWCTATLLTRIITAQWEGMGDVGSARYEPALLPPCPTRRVLCYSNFGPIWLHRIWNRFLNLDRLFTHSLGQTESGSADPWNCCLEQIHRIQDGVSWGEMYVYNTINTVYYALVVKSLEVDKKNVSLGDV